MTEWLPRFEYPQLFVLALPLWMAYRRWGATRGVTGWLRLAILATLLLALTGPTFNLGGDGLDVVLVVDRSRSMPAEATARIQELIENLEQARGHGDRLAIVTFGTGAQVEHKLSNAMETREFLKEVVPDGSDLNAALLTSLTLVDPRRPARLLVLSDGEANGGPPQNAARRARERGVPIDYRLFERIRVGDVAIQDIQLPESVSPREPFQFTVVIDSDSETTGQIVVERNGEPIATQETKLRTGTNPLRFRDLIDEVGFYTYTVSLDVGDDPLPENNVGEGGLRVGGPARVLVLTTDGVEGNLVRALRAGNLHVDVAVADRHPLTQDSLDPYRAVILENVPAGDLGRLKMDRLAQFVADLGGGLMLTGGRRSFGAGGYFQSPLDPVLPVSMELREEHRKLRVAIAIALDRSGSMSMPVGAGQTKMDLANLGTAECINLLSEGDSVAVIAVDSAPHVVQALTDVRDKPELTAAAQAIESGGGGIFVYEALVAAGEQLAQAVQQTKHIILFSDARDSERPGQYQQLLEEFAANGITVSVIGLGTEADPDAALLKDIAQRGGGNVLFTNDPQELPRLFTEDTMSVARSTFVEANPETQPEGIFGELLPSSRLLGDLGTGTIPPVLGYNLCYLRPQATRIVTTQDEYTAPLSAAWHHELGRVVALTLEVDGEFSGRFGTWDAYADFLVTHVRWLIATESTNDAFLSVRRDGQDAVVTVELDPRVQNRLQGPPTLYVVPPGDERHDVLEPDFVWTDANRLEARFGMERIGTYRPLLTLGAERDADVERLPGPAVSLPYSPEYFPRRHLPGGGAVLAEVAELSGGEARTDVTRIFEDPPRSAQHQSLLPYLFILGIVLLIVEIAGRRLALWNRGAAATVEEAIVHPDGRRGWLPKWKLRRRRRRSVESEITVASTDDPGIAGRARQSADAVFEQAKQQARKRMD